jgi:hypothetical protein
MALRFRPRHVHKTLADHVEAQLASLGWVNAPVNFDTVPITFLEFQPDEAGKEIKANTVAITLGDEEPDQPMEMGASTGGLWEVVFPVFVDVYGANAAIATSIASDVKGILSDLALNLRDYTSVADGTETAEIIWVEREQVFVERPAASMGSPDIRRYWRVVKAPASVRFQ